MADEESVDQRSLFARPELHDAHSRRAMWTVGIISRLDVPKEVCPKGQNSFHLSRSEAVLLAVVAGVVALGGFEEFVAAVAGDVFDALGEGL